MFALGHQKSTEMNQDEVLDGELQVKEFEVRIKDCVEWWEKKRLYYNIFLVVVQIVAMANIGGVLFDIENILFLVVSSTILYLCANVLYSLGWTIELLVIYHKIKVH